MSQFLEDISYITRTYFNDILYIDDALKKPKDIFTAIANKEIAVTKTEEVSEEPEVKFRPKMNVKVKKNGSSSVSTNEKVEDGKTFSLKDDFSSFRDYSNAFQLIYDFQQFGCKASPFYYEPNCNKSKLVELIDRTHLTIMDWELDETKGETTLELLDMVLSNKNRMKLLVIHTLFPDVARKAIQEKYPDNAVSDDQIQGNSYSYISFENSLLVICEKVKFTPELILETFTELLVKTYGFFPLVFFDSINKINAGTATILQKFSNPFESSLMLQLYDSGFSIKDYPKIVSRMVTNYINKVVEVDSKIFAAIINNWTLTADKLLKLTQQEFMDKINQFITKIIEQQNSNSNGKENKKILKNVNKLSYDIWVSCLNRIKESNDDWIIGINEVSKTLYDEVIKIAAIEKINNNTTLKSNLRSISSTSQKESLQKEYTKIYIKMLGEEYSKRLKPLLPPILIYFLSDVSETKQIKQTINELINLMKVIPYENSVIEEERAKENNYFNTGDILINSDRELLVCFSPSCDVFRPSKKVDNKLKFIKGKILESDSAFQELKESEHISVLPDPNLENNLICVKWDYYMTDVIDVIEDSEKLLTYSRPYRFENNYIQQMINSYIAYHSRAGVDELFLKSSTSARNFFVFPLEER